MHSKKTRKTVSLFSTYLLQVGHWQSGSMGWRSLAYCFCFTWRDPQGTKAEPNLWGKRDTSFWYGIITTKWPFKSYYQCVWSKESLLQCGWGTRSQTYHIPELHTPPNPQHTCKCMRIMHALMSIYKSIKAHKQHSSHEIFSAYRQTYPTPMRYRGFPRGRWSVLSVTIRQKSSFSSPPLRPPMAKPGTSRWVISTGRGQEM